MTDRAKTIASVVNRALELRQSVVSRTIGKVVAERDAALQERGAALSASQEAARVRDEARAELESFQKKAEAAFNQAQVNYTAEL